LQQIQLESCQPIKTLRDKKKVMLVWVDGFNNTASSANARVLFMLTGYNAIDEEVNDVHVT